MAKHYVNFQVRDLVRVVGLLPPLPHGMSVSGRNSFYRAPGGTWAQETCVGCPQQRYAMGEPGKVQGLDRVEIIEGSCGYRGPRDQYSGKIRFIEKPGV